MVNAARYACFPRRDLSLNVRNQAPLCAGVAVDVAFRGFDRPMPREQLHVTQTATRTVDVAGRDRDEAASSGMRRAALVPELVEERDEPVYDTVHPDTATSLNNLARLLQGQGDLAGARNLEQRGGLVGKRTSEWSRCR